MALASTAPLLTITDASQNPQQAANGATVVVQPGSGLNFALTNGTSGIGRWELTFICPAYPSLHQRVFTWLPGMPTTIAVGLPAEAIGPGDINGVIVLSTTSDASGGAIPQALNRISTRGAGSSAVPMQIAADYVIVASLPAYTNVGGTLTGNANGAITSAMADGATPAVGDVFLLEQGLAATATDAGLYGIVAVGASGAKFQAVQLNYGQSMMTKSEILLGFRGSVFKGTTWVNTLAGTGPGGASLIGTASFTFFCRSVTMTGALIAGVGTAGVSNTANFPAVASIFSATLTQLVLTRRTANTSTATTGGYAYDGAPTAGGLGVGAISFFATVAAGTINNADISTLDVTILNPV